MSVSGRKSALQQLHKVDLTAGHRQRVEVHIVNMDIARLMCFGKFRIDDIALVELFRTLRTVFEHRSHGGIAVNIGIFTLDLIFLRFLKGQILIDLHELGVHVPNSGTLRSVENILLGGTRVSVFDQNFLYGVLNLFYRRHLIMTNLQQIQLYLLRQIHRHLAVSAAEHLRRLKNRVCDFIDIKVSQPSVSFDNLLNTVHTFPLSPAFFTRLCASRTYTRYSGAYLKLYY